MCRVKQIGAFSFSQNAQNKIRCILKASSGRLLFRNTFCSMQRFCKRSVKALIRLHGCADWSWPLLSAYAWSHVFARRYPCIDLIHSRYQQGSLCSPIKYELLETFARGCGEKKVMIRICAGSTNLNNIFQLLKISRCSFALVDYHVTCLRRDISERQHSKRKFRAFYNIPIPS